MRRYKIFHPLWMAFYSRDLYRDVGRNWLGISFIYLLLLLLLLWAIAMLRFDQGLDSFIDHQAPQLTAQIPLIVILNGKAVAEGPQPHCVHYPDSERCFAIIDTTGNQQSAEQIDAPLVMTDRELIYRRNATESRSYSFANIDEFVLDQTLMADWLAYAKDWLALSLYPLIILVSFIYRSFQAIFYAVLGIAMRKAQKVEIPFPSLVSISVIALTPAMVIDLLSMLLGWSLAIHPLFYLLLALGYLWFGIACQQDGSQPGIRS